MIDPEGAESRPEAPAGTRRAGAAVALVVIAAIVSGAVSAGVTLAILRSQARTNPQTVDLGSNVKITEDSAIIQAAAKAAPAVATILTGSTAGGSGIGSGFLTTSDGYLVTNAGVVANAEQLTVLFAGDAAHHDARLIDSDCRLDIAVLKVDGVSNLPTLAFADTSTLRVGQTVVSIGSPLGDRVVASGIITALHRVQPISDPVTGVGSQAIADTILTSAQVDPGSSGGPVLNVAGQVLGVAVAGEGTSGNGGFAIDAADARAEVEQIVRDGRLIVPSLGVTTSQVTSGDAAFGTVPVGARVDAIEPGGPGDTAGLKVGDVITAVDEVQLDDAHPLQQVLVNQFRQGQRVTVTLNRQGSSTQVQATFGGQHPQCG